MRNPITNDVNILRDSEAVRRSVRNIVPIIFWKSDALRSGNVRENFLKTLIQSQHLESRERLKKQLLTMSRVLQGCQSFNKFRQKRI